MNDTKMPAGQVTGSNLMPRCLNHFNIFILSILLASCGGGGSGSDTLSTTPPEEIPSFTISGTITPAALVDIDSDINDPASIINTSNNTFGGAQSLQNFYTVNGFATAERTFRAGDRFENSTDFSDFYQVNLQAGQKLRLQIVDFESTAITGSAFQGDLDLILFNSDFQEVGRSESVTEFESITVPNQENNDDAFYIQVFAFGGTSKYVLSIDAVSAISTSNISMPKFMMNEAIIKFKESNPLPNAASTNASTANASLNSSTAQKIFNNRPFQLTHTSNNRAALAKFPSLQAQAFSVNKTSTQEDPAFLKELQALNPVSYERYTTLNTIKKLRVRDDVEYVQANYIRTIQQVPNDPHYLKQWHYPAINLPQAWDLTTGSPDPDTGDVIVAVIDTGVFLAHEDLDNKLVPGYDFISDPSNSADNDGLDPNPDDPGDGGQIGTSSWHGTHVAGTIAAETNNNIGVAGVSWDAKIMPLRALGLQGGTDYDIGQAALFAAGLNNDSNTVPAQKADIINLSVGGPGGSAQNLQFSQDIFDRVRAAGVIVVAAAGNEDSSQPSYPAAFNGVISVAATDFNNERAPYSNFGSTIDIAAPGGDASQDQNNDGHGDGVLSTLLDDSSGSRKDSYVFYQGTSMAAPHVAGVIALMRAVYPDLSPSDVDTLLASGNLTNDIGTAGRDDLFGYGLIDAFKAVKEAQTLSNGGVPPVLPPLVTASPSSLTLGSTSSGILTTSNVGGGNPTITSFSVNTSWLSVTTNTVDNDTGLGSYNVNIDRTNLPDSTYTGKITFNIDTGTVLKTLDVQVSIIVGTVITDGDIGTQFVLLLNPTTGELVDQAIPIKNINGEYNYQFTQIPVGSYQILGGSDIDNDLLICQLGESCGGFPVLNKLSNILITDANIFGLDFISGVLSNFGATNASNTSIKAIKLQQTPDTEHPTSKKINGAIKE